MKTTMILLLCMFSMGTYGGTSAIVIAFNSQHLPVNSYIDLDAQYVAMPVTISSDARYPAQRAKLIQTLQAAIKSAAKKNNKIEFQQGKVSLSPREKSSFSVTRSYGGREGSHLYLLAKLDDKEEIYSASEGLYRFINSIKKPEDTQLNLGSTSLAIDSPQGYRLQLLNKLKAEVSEIKSVLGEDYKVTLSGLENPVIVRQKNHNQVSVFIDYRIEFNQ